MRTYLEKPIKDDFLSNLVFKAVTKAGWKFQQPCNIDGACVYVAYPHTSNWDTILGICASYIWDRKIFVLVKEDYDKPIVRDLMKMVSMLPIQRTGGGLNASQDYYKKTGASITIAPEGTRNLGKGWKKGFHWLAKNNNLPIIIGYFNYEEKIFGWDAILTAGDTPEDTLKKCKEIIEKSKPVGKYPEKQSPIKYY